MLCWDSSFECPQHMIRKLIVNYTLCSRGLLWYNMIMNTIKCLLTVKVFSFLFVCLLFFTSQFFSHDGTGHSGLNQY